MLTANGKRHWHSINQEFLKTEDKQIKTVQNDSYGQTNEKLLLILQLGELINIKRHVKGHVVQIWRWPFSVNVTLDLFWAVNPNHRASRFMFTFITNTCIFNLISQRDH